jgi:hypothetical protein
MTKQIFFLLIILFNLTDTFGQKHSTKKIRELADSILIEYVGDTIFEKYCTYDTDTYYEYKNIFGKTKWETLDKFKKTKGRFVKVDMRWLFSILYPECPYFNTINGRTSFYLDSLLKPKNIPDLSFIPEKYWQKDSCNILDKEVILNIAKQQNLKNGIKPIEAKVTYNKDLKIFIWEITQILREDEENDDERSIEEVIINANTGEVITHEIIDISVMHCL